MRRTITVLSCGWDTCRSEIALVLRFISYSSQLPRRPGECRLTIGSALSLPNFSELTRSLRFADRWRGSARYLTFLDGPLDRVSPSGVTPPAHALRFLKCPPSRKIPPSCDSVGPAAEQDVGGIFVWPGTIPPDQRHCQLYKPAWTPQTIRQRPV
jgi:hypothetical protein